MERFDTVARIILINNVIVHQKKRVNELNTHRSIKNRQFVLASYTDIPIIHKSSPEAFASSQNNRPRIT